MAGGTGVVLGATKAIPIATAALGKSDQKKKA